MFRHANTILAILNLVTFLFILIGGGIWLANRDNTPCEKLYEKPVIAMGAIILLISLLGLTGALSRNIWLRFLCLWVLFLLLLLFSFSFMKLQLISMTIGKQPTTKAGYRFQDFSLWERDYLDETENRWNKIKACIQATQICKSIPLNDVYTNKRLSPLEVDCCMPPRACGFKMVNVTHWTEVPNISKDIQDCKMWSNEMDRLCYDCDSCKAGVLMKLREEWSHYVGIANFVSIVVLLFAFLAELSALHNEILELHGHSSSPEVIFKEA